MDWMLVNPVKTDSKLDITRLDSKFLLKMEFKNLIILEVKNGIRKEDTSTLKARRILDYCDTYDEMLDHIVQYVDVIGTRPQLELRDTCAGLGQD